MKKERTIYPQLSFLNPLAEKRRERERRKAHVASKQEGGNKGKLVSLEKMNMPCGYLFD
jgi:hypothetical protein